MFLHGGAMPCWVGETVDVVEADPLHRVQVIQVAPELLEAVRRRQRVGVVAQVVLAELAGVVAEIAQELRERRRAGTQVGRAAGKLRRDHAGAQRMHAGEEGVAPGGAALLGVIVHEDRALVPDAVDVRRLPDHQAAVVDARLHPADVIAHDEEDIGLALGPGGAGHAEHDRQGQRQHSTASIFSSRLSCQKPPASSLWSRIAGGLSATPDGAARTSCGGGPLP